jgi:hypothetical protein
LAQFTQKLAKLVKFALVKHICPKFSQIFGPETQILSKEITETESSSVTVGGSFGSASHLGGGWVEVFFMGDLFLPFSI